MSVTAPSIGMLRERHLHASLKRWYTAPGDQVELVVTYCLRRLGFIEVIGMQDRSAAYRRVPREAPGVVG